jgi:diaminopimelate epimerase
MQLSFTKMHGLGNDFMVLDLISHPVTLTSEQIRQLGDRHFGVGFDQLLLVEPPSRPDVDFNYRIFNCDGNEVEHCGNGARCFARFVLDQGLIAHTPIRVKTVNGILSLDVLDNAMISVDMGTPSFDAATLPFDTHQTDDSDQSDDLNQAVSYTLQLDVNDRHQTVRFYAVSVGNPHAVLLVDDVDLAPVQALGSVLGAHPCFPRGVNVGFMQIIHRGAVRLRVFERGAGETVACGTGACAAVVCGIAAGLLDSQVSVQLQGGLLDIRWPVERQSILMQGPATTVYEGIVKL